jgi:hypothetical protein
MGIRPPRNRAMASHAESMTPNGIGTIYSAATAISGRWTITYGVDLTFLRVYVVT